MQFPTPYMGPPAYPPYLSPFYPPPNPPQEQQNPPRKQPVTPPTSSPPQGPRDADPDLLIMRYFDHLTERFPIQADHLRMAKELILAQAFDIQGLSAWLKAPEKYPELTNIPHGLRGRIKTNLKPYLEEERQLRNTAAKAALQDDDFDVYNISSEDLLDDDEDGDDGEF